MDLGSSPAWISYYLKRGTLNILLLGSAVGGRADTCLQTRFSCLVRHPLCLSSQRSGGVLSSPGPSKVQWNRWFFDCFMSQQHVQCISATCKIYLINMRSMSHQHAKCILSTCEVYLINMQSVCQQHAKYISSTCEVCLINMQSILLICKVYLSDMKNVSHQQAKCISTCKVNLINMQSISQVPV